MVLVCFAACFISTMLGAISGIGGGVLIKPILDLTLPLGMAQISLLSSFSVLCMSLFSVAKNKLQNDRQTLAKQIAVPLAIGSTLGGVLGKLIFQQLAAALNADATIKLIQNALLFLLMLVVLMWTLRQKESGAAIGRSVPSGLMLSFALGLLAAFLGIGGGPLNMLVITAFYGLTHKEGALYSLLIIVFSQTAGILTALLSGTAAPEATLLLAACAAGLLGGVVGRGVAKRLGNNAVRVLYCIVLVAILGVCAVNIVGL